MSVLSCSRSNCQNIMCDCYVPSLGYICKDCQEEFVEQWSEKIGSVDDIFAALQQFINIEFDIEKFDSWKKPALRKFFEDYTD